MVQQINKYKFVTIFKTVSLGTCSFVQGSNSHDAAFEMFFEATTENCLLRYVSLSAIE